MIGSLIQFGINMAAYAASAKGVRVAARTISSNFKRVVKEVNRQAAKRDFGMPEISRRIVSLTSDRSMHNAQKFVTRTIDSAHNTIQRKVSPSAYKVLKQVGRGIKDEALFLPANYGYYRMEKHRAVSPEEKQNTSSFAKYYLGMPMVTSIGSGLIMDNMKMGNTAIKMIGRKLKPNQRDQMVRGISSGARAGAVVMDLSIAAARATKRKYSEYGISSVLSFGNRPENTAAIHDLFKRELRDLRRSPSQLDKRFSEIRSFNKQIDADLARNLKTQRAKSSKEVSRQYTEQANMVKEDFRKEVTSAYGKSMQKESPFMSFMNKMADTLKDERFRTKRMTDKELGLPTDYGKYVVGNTEVDFGRMNTSFMKDLLIKRAGHGASNFVISMFGQDEIVQYHHSDHAISTAFTKINRKGNVFLGKSYFDPSDTKSAEMLAREIIGINPFIASDEERQVGEMFYKSQYQTVQKRHQLKQKGQDDDYRPDVLMKAYYRHGSVPIKSGDYLVHQPGGALKLYTSYADDDGIRKPFSVRLGGHEGGYLEYYKFTRDTNSSAGRAMRSFAGSEEFNISKGNSINVGATQVGQIIRDNEDEGLMSRVRNMFDIGYSDKQFMGRKITSVFRKFTDPRYAKTFFDQSYIGNHDFQQAIADDVWIRQETIKTLKQESTEAMEYFTAKSAKRAGGRKNFIGLISKSGKNTNLGELDPVQYMIYDEMEGNVAHENILKFSTFLSKMGKNYDIPRDLMLDDMKRTDRVRDLFIESEGTKTVSDIFSNVSTGKKMFIDGRYHAIDKMDEYNSMVLRITSGLDHDKEFGLSVQNVIKGEFYANNNSPADVAAFSAASHMSKFQHKLMSSIKEYSENLASDEGITGNINKVKEVVGMFADPKGLEYKEISGYYNKSWKHAGILPHDIDNRFRVEDSNLDEIFAVPKGAGSGIVSKSFYNVNGRKIEVAKGVMDASNIAIMSLLHSFNRVASESLGMGLDETINSTPGRFIRNTITKRVLPGIAAYMGYSLLDRAVDYTMDGTPLGEGITVFGANILAGARVAAASIFDVTGVTAGAKYLEDLMPGFIESPLSGALRFAGPIAAGITMGGKRGGAVGSLKGGLIGTAVGALLGGGPLGLFGQWNINKSREEVIDILSGKEEVAVKKGRWWEVGRSAFEGCLTTDSIILDKDCNERTIQSININDSIYDMNGDNRNITATKQRDHKGLVYNIQSHMNNIYDLWLTGNHPVYAIKRTICKRNKPIGICHQNRIYSKCNDCKHKTYKTYKPEWIKTEDLTKDDILIFPRIKLEHNYRKLDIRDLNLRYYLHENGIAYYESNRHIYNDQIDNEILQWGSLRTRSKERNDKLQFIIRKYNLSYNQIRYRLADLRKNSKIGRISGLHPVGPYPIDGILLDYSFGRLLGFYASEGNVDEYGTITFTLNKDEHAYIYEILYLLSLIHKGIINTETIDNSTNITIHNHIMGNIITTLIPGKAINGDKHINPILFNAPIGFLQGFLSAFICGDGSVSNNRLRVSIGQSSKRILTQIQLLLSSFGIYSTIRSRYSYLEKTNKRYIGYDLRIQGIDVNYLSHLLGGVIKGYSFDMIESNRTYFEVPILDITTKDYDGLVYDIEVKDGESFLSPGITLHNSRIEYYRPHYYAMLRSGYKDTPGFKDSFIKDVAGVLAPDIYAMQNYYSRPYPVTAGLFSNIPVVSNMMQMVPGFSMLTGAGIEMHKNDWSGRYYKSVAGDSGVTSEDLASMYGNQSGYFASTSPVNGSSGMDPSQLPTERPMLRSDFEYAFGESMSNIKDIVGMRGFLLGSAYSSLTGRKDPFDYAPELATAADVGGIRREYWDMSLGGVLGMSEALRRYLPNKRSQMEVFNPLVNAMPSWLPDEEYLTDFMHGDAYTKLPMGESRLPGPGYETMHNVNMAMPIEGDILEESFDSQMAFYLGMPEYMAPRNKKMELARNVADKIRSDARNFGDIIKGETSVYNARLDTRSTVDVIIKDKTGNRLPVKVMPKGFGGEGALNAFLTMSELDQGMLVEVDTESGDIVEKMINKDITRFTQDVQRTQGARWASYRQMGELEKSGKAMNMGNAYSWFDRFRILADVGMYSKEFREADAIVQQQIDAGYLKPNQVNEYFKVKNQIKEKEKAFNFSEYRFMNLGESLTEEGKQREQEIMNKYNPVERTVGAAWEYVSHFRTPIHSKLLHKTSALEEYERNVIYGKTMPMWDNPYEDFIKSYTYQMVAEDDPLQNAISWGTGALTLDTLTGFAPSIGFMMAAGAAVGSANAISGKVFIPQRVEEQREVITQMDAIEYARWKSLYIQTGDKRYSVKASRTMAGSIANQKILDPMVAAPALGGQDKYYLEDIISNVTRDNLSRVAQVLPESSLPVLYNAIGDTKTATAMQRNNLDRTEERMLPTLDSSVYNPEVPIEIPTIKTFEMEGLNCLTGTTQIISINGMIDIKDITETDKILTPSGTFEFPIRKYKSYYTGDIVTISFTRTPYSLSFTPDHIIPVLQSTSKYIDKYTNSRRAWNKLNVKAKELLNRKRRWKLTIPSLPLEETVTEYKGIALNNDLATILGWYLAEGYLPKRNNQVRSVSMGLHINEINYANEIASCIKKVFNTNTYIATKYKSSTSGNPYTNLSSCGKYMATIIHELCGSLSHSKILNPIILNADLTFIQRIMECWFLGDGWTTQKEICVHTNSKQLAFQGWHILLSIGIDACLQYIKPRKNKSEGWRIRISKAKYPDPFHMKWERRDHSELSVNNVTISQYNGNIYDLEMNSPHYYSTVCGTVHNSHDAGLGWYSQIAAGNRLKAMGKYRDETLYAGAFESKVTQREIQNSLNTANQLRVSLRKIANNVNIIEDGMDRIEVEIIM